MARMIECPKCKHSQELNPAALDKQGRFACENCGTKIHVKRKATASTLADVVEDADEETAPETVAFKQGTRIDEEMDLTPMVDVTFLLLIFFMVTASFAMQKSLDLPTTSPESSQEARSIMDVERDNDNIIIRIDEDNTIWVNDSVAPSDQEMIAQLRETRGADGAGPSKLMIFYHPESQVQQTVRAHDAGTAVGMESIEWRMVDSEF